MIARSAIRSVFLAAAGLLIASFLFVYYVGRVAVESHARLSFERQTVNSLERFFSSIKDAETGQRGYLLTGDEGYLEPYRLALTVVSRERAVLRQDAASGDLPATSVDRAIRLSEEKLAELQRSIQLRRANGLEAALAVLKEGHGKAVMDELRAAVTEMIQTETQELEEAAHRAEASVLMRTGAFVLTLMFNLAFISWAYRRLSTESTGREAALAEVSRQKELVSTTLSSIGDGVIVTDAGGRVGFINGEAARLTGWSPAEAAGRPLPEVFRIVNEQTRRTVENPVDKVLRQGTVVGLANHTLLLSKGGTEVPIDDSAAPIRPAGGELSGVVLVFRDVTQQRRAEEARARLAAIVESSGDAIFTMSPEGEIRTWNAGAERLLGYAASEILGKPAALLVPPGTSGKHPEVLARLKTGLSSELTQARARTKDGKEVPVLANLSALRDGEGTLTGASVILQDITEMVAAQETLARGREELERLVQERTVKLREMIDELQHVSYAISHDMRAPLRAMGSFAQLLLQDVQGAGLSEEAVDYCRRIVTGAARLDALIHDALTYNQAVLKQVAMGPVALDALLQGLLRTYPNFHPDQADIRIEGALPVVRGNEALLTQCFSNLLGNAVKFVGKGVRPTVRVRPELHDGMVRVWIEDNGIGIPKHAQDRIFGMFQKLESGYDGTGVGLAIVRKVVERMDGRVGVESDGGPGSRFWVDLPLAEEKP